MADIGWPSNLADNDECKVLWSNIDLYGIDMDKISDNWNEIILDSAFDLIEKGCVKRKIIQ